MMPRSFNALLMVMQPEGGCTIKKHQRALIALYKVQRAQQLLKDWVCIKRAQQLLKDWVCIKRAQQLLKDWVCIKQRFVKRFIC